MFFIHSDAEPVPGGKMLKVVATIEQYGEFTGLGFTERLATQGARMNALQRIKSLKK